MSPFVRRFADNPHSARQTPDGTLADRVRADNSRNVICKTIGATGRNFCTLPLGHSEAHYFGTSILYFDKVR